MQTHPNQLQRERDVITYIHVDVVTPRKHTLGTHTRECAVAGLYGSIIFPSQSPSWHACLPVCYHPGCILFGQTSTNCNPSPCQRLNTHSSARFLSWANWCLPTHPLEPPLRKPLEQSLVPADIPQPPHTTIPTPPTPTLTPPPQKKTIFLFFMLRI